MKKILLAVSITAITLSAWAQVTPRKVNLETKLIEADRHFFQSIGIEFGLPVGEQGENYSAGIGASYTANFLINETFAISGDLSYMNLIGKTINNYAVNNLSNVNILAGPRVVVNNNTAVAVRAGVSIVLVKKNSDADFAWQAEATQMLPGKLGKIPVLGALFRYTSNTTSRVELGIFIRPRIIIDNDD